MATIRNSADVFLQTESPRILSAAPSTFTNFFTASGCQLNCLPSSNLSVVRYEYRVGAAFNTATVISQDGGTNYLWSPQIAGTYTVWVSAVDNRGIYSAAVSQSISILTSTMSSFTSSVSGRNIQLNWTAIPGSYGALLFEVRSGISGVTWATATSLGFYNNNTYQEVVSWSGNKDYLVAALDVASNYSAPMRLAIALSAPGAPTALTAQVVDNNVLLYWAAPSITPPQLAIVSYEVRKGSTWATGIPLGGTGSNGNSTFCGIFEQQSGTYTYWAAAIDAAGVYGTPVSISAVVNQPPDFILRSDIYSTFTGTLVNAYFENGLILLPANTSQTFATHFTANSWTTPAAQIGAGEPIYISPSLTTASYEEIINYGAVIPTTIASSLIAVTAISGVVTPTCTISWKLLSGDAWTVLPSGTNALISSNFQYVRYHWDFATTAGANLIRIISLEYKLSIKLRNDSGTVAINTGNYSVPTVGQQFYGIVSTPVTTITFGYPFIYADTPVVTVNGLDTHGKAYTAAVLYINAANPTKFYVQVFDSTGAQVSSSAGVSFSWTARGY